MKALILIFSLLTVCTVLVCNPVVMVESIVSEIWFNEAGHLMVELSPYGINDCHLNQLVFKHGDYQEVLPDSTLITQDGPPLIVDISELMPGPIISPVADSLVVMYTVDNIWFLWLDYLKWGSSINGTVSSLLPGQSMARYIKWEEGDYGPYPDFHWVKDEPPTPGTQCNEPVARAVLKVSVTDQDNHPVPEVTGCYPFAVYPGSFTDANGEYADTLLAERIRIGIRHPLTNEIVYDEQFWLEPNDTLAVVVRIDMPSDYPYTKYKGLHAFPTPFKSGRDVGITFRYYGKTELKGLSYIKIYNIRGQYICNMSISTKGFAYWQPGPDIRSGLYVARLVSGNKIIDTTSFSILK